MEARLLPTSPRPDALPFDLRQLEIFLQVCDSGTMVAAARVLGLTQPAVSQAVSELEARAGVTLLDRAVRPLALTAAGLVLRPHAAALLAEARQIGPLLRRAQAAGLPLLRAGLVDSLQRALAAPLATYLGAVAARTVFLSGLTAFHASALLTRQLDMFLGVDNFGDVDGIERWDVAEESYVLLCPAELPIPRVPADLATLSERVPLVRFSARSGTGTEIERHLRRLGLDLPRAAEFDTPHGVTAMVANGGGWAITTPLCLHEAAVLLDGLACHPLPGPALRRRLLLVARRRELGPIPARTAEVARTVLRDRCLPAIARTALWLASQVQVMG